MSYFRLPQTDLEREIAGCTICAEHLPNPPKPVVSLPETARVAIISQAPGRLAHNSGIPWDDPSGKRLRKWLGVDEVTFYESGVFAILPTGFCFPGTGKSGDLPPRPECAPKWHALALEALPNLELKLIIGAYATKNYLGKRRKKNLTETVRHFNEYLPDIFPLVHPSPRNMIWERRNPWFLEDVVPPLQAIIQEFLP